MFVVKSSVDYLPTLNLLILVLLALLVLPGCQSPDLPEAGKKVPSDSHQQMVDLLKQVKEDQPDSMFFGDQDLRMAQQMLKEMSE